jgi:hypothetical protein
VCRRALLSANSVRRTDRRAICLRCLMQPQGASDSLIGASGTLPRWRRNVGDGSGVRGLIPGTREAWLARPAGRPQWCPFWCHLARDTAGNRGTRCPPRPTASDRAHTKDAIRSRRAAQRRSTFHVGSRRRTQRRAIVPAERRRFIAGSSGLSRGSHGGIMRGTTVTPTAGSAQDSA